LDRFGEQWRLLGQDLAPRLPVQNGTLLVLGALLLMAVFSTDRWRKWPAAETAVSIPTSADAEASPAEAGDETDSGSRDEAPAGTTEAETSESPTEAGTATKSA
jgi:hypothetical protein